MIGLLKLCRWFYAVPISLIFLLTIYYARGGDMDGQWRAAIIATASLVLLIMSGHVINDVFDVKRDLINAPWRPIPSGKISRKTAAIFGILLTVISLSLCLACRPLFLVAMVCVCMALLIYNLFSIRMGPLKGVFVAALMTSLYPLAFAQAGMITGSRAGSLAIFPIWVFLASWSFEIFKDVRDMRGDRKSRGLADPADSSLRRYRRFGDCVGTIAAPLLILPFFAGCGSLFLCIALLAVCVRVICLFLPVKRKIMAVYIEFVLVGIAATVDVMVTGFSEVYTGYFSILE